MDEDVTIKISVCQKCDGIVRASVVELMNDKAIAEFAKEVFDYNLSVKQQPISEYRRSIHKWCTCK